MKKRKMYVESVVVCKRSVGLIFLKNFFEDFTKL